MFAVSSPIPLPNPAAFEDKLLVKKQKRGLETPTPKCPSTPVRSPYMHHPHSTHHLPHNLPQFHTPHPHPHYHHQPRGLALRFDLLPSSSASSTAVSSSSSSSDTSSHTANMVDSMKNKSCYTELKRCSRSDQFTIKKTLGTGTFGTVYEVAHVGGGHTVGDHNIGSNTVGGHSIAGLYAMKKSRKPIWNTLQRARYLTEFRNARALSPHPSITQVLEAWEEGGHIYTLMVLCKESLKDHLAEGSPEEKTVWLYIADIIRGVHHMHNHNVLHLDIKPDNILIGFDSSLKLTDFGISTIMGSDMEASEGDKIYMAPELLEENFTPAADIFSVGITLYEMVTGYDLPGKGQAWRNLREGHFTFPEDTNISSELKTLIIDMMHPEPTKRPTAATILTHPKVAPHVPIDLPPRKKVTRKLFE